jgi:hypothetical protein
MSIIAKAKGNIPAPAGSHSAVCIKVIDLGMQDHPEYGANRKCYLEFELPDELMEDTGKPFAIGRRFTLSLSSKSALREVLENWRGRPFTATELQGFQLDKLVGIPALVTIQHRQNGEKTYANLTSVAPLPKGMKKPKQVNPSLVYACDQGEDDTFEQLPEWLQNVIRDRVGGPGSQKKTPVKAATDTGDSTDL